MKNSTVILLPIIVDICSDATSEVLNTGIDSHCLESITTKLVLAKDGFVFDTKDDFKNKVKWDEAILAKNLAPLYDVYELQSADEEATFFTSGSYKRQTKKAVKVLTCESYCSLYAHKVLKSYEDSSYNHVFEITENGEVIGVFNELGKIKGQDLTSFIVGIRTRPTPDKPPYSPITVTYRDYDELENNGYITSVGFDPNTLDGVFSLVLMQTAIAAQQIQFKALYAGGSKTYGGLLQANMKLTDDNNNNLAIDDMSYNAQTGVYTLDSAALADGYLSTNGVVTIGGLMFESDVLAVDVP